VEMEDGGVAAPGPRGEENSGILDEISGSKIVSERVYTVGLKHSTCTEPFYVWCVYDDNLRRTGSAGGKIHELVTGHSQTRSRGLGPFRMPTELIGYYQGVC
jgi:hypothetical protein